jgi:hypothetical protein
LRDKGLEVKSLFLFHLGMLRCGLGLPFDIGPPFRPDQKVKLDKGEARIGGYFLAYDGNEVSDDVNMNEVGLGVP